MANDVKTKSEEFSKIVRRYCEWAERPASSNEEEFDTIQKLLGELSLAALDLPDVFKDDAKLDAVSIEEWKAVKERFSHLPVNGYWTIFDPTQARENDTVFAQLSDDLADIYQDIEYGLSLFEAGHIEDAIWHWKFNFKIHWGRHLLNAQKVIYSWNFNNDEF